MDRKKGQSKAGFKLYGTLALVFVAIILIFISIAGVVASLGFGSGLINKDFFLFSLPTWAYIIILVISFIWMVVAKTLVQKYRDEFEYDENGINRKKGSFSQLSKQEREEIDRQKMIDLERILPSTDLKRIAHEGSSNPDKDMNNIVGLDNVKQDMYEMLARLNYEKEHLEKELKGKSLKEKKKIKEEKKEALSAMHMVFMGPPGTGKTTVARIMTGFLFETGYIRKNQIIEIDGNYLTGLNASESTKKTTALILKALGGVLFIDEAYALVNDRHSNEILATLVKEMEDRRGQFILIMAGYDKEMKKMISANPGIESRVKRYFWFGDYSVSDLQQIFIQMAGSENLTVSSDMMNLFVDRIVYEQKQPNFGNARTVRNLLDKIIDRHAVNLMQGVNTEEEKYVLTAHDMPEIDTHKHI